LFWNHCCPKRDRVGSGLAEGRGLERERSEFSD
jgi:hypothetical protein